MTEMYNGDMIPSPEALFADNPEQRCPCLLLLDTSRSMSRGEPGASAIEQLNEGLIKFREAIATDSVASRRVETAIVTFGDGVHNMMDFSPIEYFAPPELTAGGLTPLGRAIDCALETIENQKQLYKSNGISYYRPWVFLITDGEPTDDGWEAAVDRIHQAEDEKKLILFAVGVEPVNMTTLNKVAHPSRPAIKLKDQQNSFMELFKWLSSSMAAVSRSGETGGQVTLPPVCFGTVETS